MCVCAFSDSSRGEWHASHCHFHIYQILRIYVCSAAFDFGMYVLAQQLGLVGRTGGGRSGQQRIIFIYVCIIHLKYSFFLLLLRDYQIQHQAAIQPLSQSSTLNANMKRNAGTIDATAVAQKDTRYIYMIRSTSIMSTIHYSLLYYCRILRVTREVVECLHVEQNNSSTAVHTYILYYISMYHTYMYIHLMRRFGRTHEIKPRLLPRYTHIHTRNTLWHKKVPTHRNPAHLILYIYRFSTNAVYKHVVYMREEEVGVHKVVQVLPTAVCIIHIPGTALCIL